MGIDSDENQYVKALKRKLEETEKKKLELLQELELMKIRHSAELVRIKIIGR